MHHVVAAFVVVVVVVVVLFSSACSVLVAPLRGASSLSPQGPPTSLFVVPCTRSGHQVSEVQQRFTEVLHTLRWAPPNSPAYSAISLFDSLRPCSFVIDKRRHGGSN